MRDRRKGRDSDCRCSSAAAKAPANTVAVEESGGGPHTTAQRKVSRAEAGLVPMEPASSPSSPPTAGEHSSSSRGYGDASNSTVVPGATRPLVQESVLLLQNLAPPYLP